MKLHYESYANAVLGLQSVSEDGLGDQHGSSAWLSHASEVSPSLLNVEHAFVATVVRAPRREGHAQPRHRNNPYPDRWVNQRAGRGRSNARHAPVPSSSRGLGVNGATLGHPGLYEVELNSLNTV
jgi:hypothetical protein